jgi:hypothetical protein
MTEVESVARTFDSVVSVCGQSAGSSVGIVPSVLLWHFIAFVYPYDIGQPPPQISRSPGGFQNGLLTGAEVVC